VHVPDVPDKAARLLAHELRVVAVVRHEFVMAAGLDNAAVLQHDDAVSIHDGAQPVRDDEGGAIGNQGFERAVYRGLRIGIELSRFFVEDDDGRLLDQCPRDRDPLALTD
jgi:hypothetical protein